MRILSTLVAAFLALCLVGSAGSLAQDSTFDPAQKGAIEKIVHEYLLKHPEVIRDAIEVLQAREAAAKADQQASALGQYKEKLLADPLAPTAGNPVGDVAIVEFFDYKCPYCKRVTPALIELLEADKGVKVVFKEFPILGDASLLASRAALAAVKQDKYLDFHNALMAHRGDFDDAAIEAVATSVGLDVSRLKSDMEAPEIEQQIKDNRELALALGIRSTPTFVIGDQVVPGAMSIDDMKAAIADFRGGS